MNELALFCGGGGSILAGKLLGWRTRCADPKESRRRQSARAVDAALRADDYTAMPRDPDDVARGMDGLKATGNGWVPQVAARAFQLLSRA